MDYLFGRSIKAALIWMPHDEPAGTLSGNYSNVTLRLVDVILEDTLLYLGYLI